MAVTIALPERFPCHFVTKTGQKVPMPSVAWASAPVSGRNSEGTDVQAGAAAINQNLQAARALAIGGNALHTG